MGIGEGGGGGGGPHQTKIMNLLTGASLLALAKSICCILNAKNVEKVSSRPFKQMS